MSEADNLDALIAMLKNLALSQGLDDTQLGRLAKSATMIRLNEGQSPFYTEIRDERFFIVVSGKVRATFVRGRKKSLSSIIRSEDFFGAEKVLYRQTSLESAVAIEPSVLIWIDAIPLAGFLREIPQLRQNLRKGFEFYRLRQNKHFAWLTENEKIILKTRKHKLVLLISLLAPLGVGWVGVIFLWLATLTHVLSIRAITSWSGIGVMGLALLWAVWRGINWSIDIYIVTDQRLVWQQQFFGLYDSRMEIPMAMIMPPKMNQSRYERVLGFGDVFAATDKTPVDYQVYIHIDLLDIPSPERIRDCIEQYGKQASTKAGKVVDESIQRVIAQYREQQPNENKSPDSPSKTGDAQKKMPPISKRLKDTFKTRLEDGGTITYRKHWIVLFRKVWLPTLISLIVLSILVFILFQRVTNRIANPSVLTLICVGLIIYIIPVGWWIYQVRDWRNDIYQFIDNKLYDVERTPFFGPVSLRPTLVSKIRNLDFERPGILDRLLNSGSIYIGTSDNSHLDFIGVHEPDRILREIYYRVYILRQKNIEADLRRQHENITKVVDAYHRYPTGGRKL